MSPPVLKPVFFEAPNPKRVQKVCWIALFLFTLFVSYCSLLPMQGWTPPKDPIFETIIQNGMHRLFLFDLIQNILLYLPFGVFITFAVSYEKPKFGIVLLLSFLVGFGLSTFLECMQTMIPSRVPSASDIVTNAMGSVLGAFVCLFFFKPLKHYFYRVHTQYLYPLSFKRPIPLIGLSLILGWVFYHWYPFLPTLDPNYLEASLKPLKESYQQWSSIENLEFMYYAIQFALLYGCALLCLRQAQFIFLFCLLTFVALLKITIMGRFLSGEWVLGSYTGLFVAACLHQIILLALWVVKRPSKI